jgi:dienelactone hydrolase
MFYVRRSPSAFAALRSGRLESVMNLKTESVAYTHHDTPLTGYLVWDDSRSDPRPGIFVVHGGAGLDEHARGRAQRLAALGYVVLAGDMYGDGAVGNRERIMACIADLRGDRPRLRARAQAGIDRLASHPLVNGRLAAVGYCFGGMTVLEVARGGAALTGVVSVHGSLETAGPGEPASIQAKILVCHGALDPYVPMAHVTAFVEEMNHARADYQLIVYGGAMHGFTHDVGGPAVPGVAYHAPTDVRSSAAIRTFLTEIFG